MSQTALGVVYVNDTLFHTTTILAGSIVHQFHDVTVIVAGSSPDHTSVTDTVELYVVPFRVG